MMKGVLKAVRVGGAKKDNVATTPTPGFKSVFSAAGSVVKRPQVEEKKGPDDPLSLALRKVTHTDTAAVPQQHIWEAYQLAIESEATVVRALRHIEENIEAPASEWRRLHGTLLLLDCMLRPPPQDRAGPGLKCGKPVGRLWYEAKASKHVRRLCSFAHAKDSRVSSLIQHSARNVKDAADKHLSDDEDEEWPTEPSAARPKRAPTRTSPMPDLLGRGQDEERGEDGEEEEGMLEEGLVERRPAKSGSPDRALVERSASRESFGPDDERLPTADKPHAVSQSSPRSPCSSRQKRYSSDDEATPLEATSPSAVILRGGDFDDDPPGRAELLWRLCCRCLVSRRNGSGGIEEERAKSAQEGARLL